MAGAPPPLLASDHEPARAIRHTGLEAGAAGAQSGCRQWRITPMMEQYVEITGGQPGLPALLPDGRFLRAVLRRRGDSPRGRSASALTKRGKHLGDDIPMCGVPVHAADDYLQKLIALGHRVAVCEQTEDPADARQRRVGRAARRYAARHARHDHRGAAARLRPQQLSGGARAGRRQRRRRPPRARLDRHLHRRVPRRRVRRRAALATALARIEPREVLVLDRLASDAEMRCARGRPRRGAHAAAGGILRCRPMRRSGSRRSSA